MRIGVSPESKDNGADEQKTISCAEDEITLRKRISVQHIRVLSVKKIVKVTGMDQKIVTNHTQKAHEHLLSNEIHDLPLRQLGLPEIEIGGSEGRCKLL